jgi:hypothetical protein
VILVDDAHLGGTTRGPHLHKELHVGGVILRPLLWQIILVIDGLHWTYRFTRTTVHTFVRMDIEHSVALIDAIHRAFVNATAVFEIYAGQSDDVGHGLGILSELTAPLS